jgi:hypothetical protein
MHPVKVPGIGKVGKIAADGLQGHIETVGQILDHHPPFGAGKFEDFGLPEVERHVPFPSYPAFVRSGTARQACQRFSDPSSDFVYLRLQQYFDANAAWFRKLRARMFGFRNFA